MTVRDVTDLLLAARGRIDFYWNFYIAVVVAVIGWLMSRKAALTRSMKLLISFVYIAAALMNYLGLYSAYTLAEALRVDLLQLEPVTAVENTRRLLEQHSYLRQRLVALAVHVSVGIAVLLVIWKARFSADDANRSRVG